MKVKLGWTFASCLGELVLGVGDDELKRRVRGFDLPRCLPLDGL